MNSTAKIWWTCKRPHFNKFPKSTNTNTSTQASSNINKPKYTLKLSSARYLSLSYWDVIQPSWIHRFIHIHAHLWVYKLFASASKAKPLICSFYFPAQAIFSASPLTSFLRKTHSVVFFCRYWMCLWSFSESPNPSLWQCCLSLSPGSWWRLWEELGCLCTSLDSFPVTTPSFTLKP